MTVYFFINAKLTSRKCLKNMFPSVQMPKVKTPKPQNPIKFASEFSEIKKNVIFNAIMKPCPSNDFK